MKHSRQQQGGHRSTRAAVYLTDWSLRRSSVWNVYLHWIMGGKQGGEEDGKRKVTQAKTHSNAPANLPGVHPNIPGKNAALAWFELCLNYI